MVRYRLAAACVAAALAACAGPQRYVGTDPLAFTLRIWVDDHPLLDARDALAACNEWRVKGVACALADGPDSADVRVMVNGDPCTEDKDGLRTLALAYPDAHVEFFRRCYERGDGSYDRHMFRAVMTHEIGHEIGIWDHVPEKCAKDAAASRSGPVCRIAVMNKLYDHGVTFVTVIDGRAFEVRNTDTTALVPVAERERGHARQGARGPLCIYRGR